MKKKFAAAVFALLAMASTAFAQTNAATSSASKITPATFPIAELGGCGSKEACKAYCDVDANKDACFTYAQSHGLMSKDEITLAKKLRAQIGPGGCKGEECKPYCNDPSHTQMCIEFAKQNGFISKEDAAKRVERFNLSTTTRMLPPMEGAGSSTAGSTTRPIKPPEPRPASTAKPMLKNDTRPSTSPAMPGNASAKPPTPPQEARSTNPDGTNIDYSRPPYHCTPAQAEEGACDADQLPGYLPPPGSEQGGSVWLGILKFFGF